MKAKMTHELPFEALTKGYILLPKKMLEELLDVEQQEMSELEATLKILVTVNYKDNLFTEPDGQIMTCLRGESFRSWQSWADLFGWKRCKTRRFFLRLQKKGIIEMLPQVYTLHIRVKDYDLWTGCRAAAMKKIADNADHDFNEFWDAYHETTHTNKVNLTKARKEWRKLTTEEHHLAIERIEEYYIHLENTKYCLQAVNYLSNRAFENEYEY